MLKSVRERMSKDITTDPAESAAACRYFAGIGGLFRPQAQQAPTAGTTSAALDRRAVDRQGSKAFALLTWRGRK